MWRRSYLSALLLWAFAIPSRAVGQAEKIDGAGWTLVRLDLDVTVGDSGPGLRFAGRARLRLAAHSSPGPALSLNSRVPALRYTRFTSPQGSSTLNETLASDSAMRVARIRFDGPRRRGDVVDVDFAYQADRESSQLIMHPRISLASWVENWYPTPISADGYSAAVAAAPGITRFHLPRGWYAVSNGRPGGRQERGARVTDTWIVEQPVARSFAAAPYAVGLEGSGGRPIGVFLLSASASSAGAQARMLDRALRAMERRFGSYPYDSYAIAEVPENVVTWAASSEQGFIMATTSMFDATGGNLPLFAHEAAHGWWGNAVSTKGPGATLGTESLAQYGAVVAIEALEGRAAAREFLRFSRAGYNPLQCALGYFHIWRVGGDKPLARLAADKWDHNLSDSKGMWVYHMIRQRMGDAAFFGALRQLQVRFKAQPMTVQDIRDQLIAASPADTGLRTFLSQWIDRKGAPVLDVDWWSERRPPASEGAERGFGAAVRVRQRQAGEPFVLDIEVALTLHDSSTVVDTVYVSQKDQTFELDLPSRPLDLRVDPFHRVLIWRPEYGPRPPDTE